jgi:hypothetical protein
LTLVSSELRAFERQPQFRVRQTGARSRKHESKGTRMPFYRVTSHSLLVEATNPVEAAMFAYRTFEDRTPTDFQVVGPDVEVSESN